MVVVIGSEKILGLGSVCGVMKCVVVMLMVWLFDKVGVYGGRCILFSDC